MLNVGMTRSSLGIIVHRVFVLNVVCFNRGIEMARKFKIGDIIQVVKDVGGKIGDTLGNSFKVGHRGTITGYDSIEDYPYSARRKNGNYEQFKVQELKLIKRGTK